jgi:CRISPR-associated endonuclease/helicase Cas3
MDDPEAFQSRDEEVTDPDVSSFRGRAVKLSKHSRDVERWARNICEHLGHLKSSKLIAEAIVFAAWLHDAGKADPRFQRLLRDGSEISMLKDRRREPSDWMLAKSDMDERGARRQRAAADRSGYPPGTRHEMLSLAMVQANADVLAEAKRRGLDNLHWELVLHLVASHHGWCRPYPPSIVEPDKALQVSYEHAGLGLSANADHGLHRLDSGVSERFARLNQRFGSLQLAWFEAILRLADHRASEQEADDGRA